MTAVVETIALTKTYGSARGIHDVSLRVEPGEVFGFLGPNGAGKTTTIRTLLDLQRPTSGEARIFGLDSRRDSALIRARTGNLSGDFDFDPKLTGREMLGYLAALRGMRDLGSADTLAERFSADLSRPLGDLSRGNRQKIGLINAFFHDPDLLILDEPTSGFDPLMQEEFLSLVHEQRDADRTVFLSSHDLDEVQRVCDRVGMIREGRLTAVERVSDLIKQSYRRVRIEFAGPVDAHEFARLPGVQSLEADGRVLTFTVTGPLDAIVKQAAQHEVVDMELGHPNLEEIFVAMYGRTP
ncbi:MAG TPA: ABC transporter ATP-binding protein [Thermoleophilaceae bacterium]|jgi:ABC-2 type transport system ATP-binding protein|nr:ABC transporter ATP-binding protein [Thermoleophilaceae bacterium]